MSRHSSILRHCAAQRTNLIRLEIDDKRLPSIWRPPHKICIQYITLLQPPGTGTTSPRSGSFRGAVPTPPDSQWRSPSPPSRQRAAATGCSIAVTISLPCLDLYGQARSWERARLSSLNLEGRVVNMSRRRRRCKSCCDCCLHFFYKHNMHAFKWCIAFSCGIERENTVLV